MNSFTKAVMQSKDPGDSTEVASISAPELTSKPLHLQPIVIASEKNASKVVLVIQSPWDHIDVLGDYIWSQDKGKRGFSKRKQIVDALCSAAFFIDHGLPIAIAAVVGKVLNDVSTCYEIESSTNSSSQLVVGSQKSSRTVINVAYVFAAQSTQSTRVPIPYMSKRVGGGTSPSPRVDDCTRHSHNESRVTDDMHSQSAQSQRSIKVTGPPIGETTILEMHFSL